MSARLTTLAAGASWVEMKLRLRLASSWLAVGLIAYAFLFAYAAIALAPASWWVGAARDSGVPDLQAAYAYVFGQGLWTIAGSITAFCGPIAFLGLATPHVARGLCKTSDYTTLLPITLLTGASLALCCDLIIKVPGAAGLPLNAITAFLGAPVVAWVLWSGKRWARTA